MCDNVNFVGVLTLLGVIANDLSLCIQVLKLGETVETRESARARVMRSRVFADYGFNPKG